jgi:hypothetical protein
MRTLVVLALVSGGCSTLIGIADPVAGRDGGGDAPPADSRVADASGPNGDGDGDGDGGPDAGPIGAPCIAPPSFAAPDTYPLSGTPGLIATGDFDRDGKQDVAIALTTKVLILHGDGTGTLGRPQELDTAADGVVAADFENKVRDALVLWTVGGSSVVERRQDPSVPGGFLAPQPLAGPFTGVRRVLIGFLDGAFVPDVIVQDDAERRVYTSNLGTPGTFARGDAIGAAGDQVIQVANLIGVDNDDVVLVTAAGGVAIASQVSSHYESPLQVATGATTAAGFGRLDASGDDDRDLIVATPGGGALYRRSDATAATFSRVAGAIAGVTGSTLQIVDVDGDGHDDLVVAGGIVQQCTPGVFSPLVPFSITPSTVFRDLDGNGKPELLRIVDRTLEVYRQ